MMKRGFVVAADTKLLREAFGQPAINAMLQAAAA